MKTEVVENFPEYMVYYAVYGESGYGEDGVDDVTDEDIKLYEEWRDRNGYGTCYGIGDVYAEASFSSHPAFGLPCNVIPVVFEAEKKITSGLETQLSRSDGLTDSIEYYIGIYDTYGKLNKEQLDDLASNVTMLKSTGAYPNLCEEAQKILRKYGYKTLTTRVKSGWERTDMASGPIWDNGNYRIIEKGDFDSEDKYYILRDKSNQSAKDTRFDTLAEAMDYIDFRANLNSSRQIKSSQKGFENVVENTQYDDYHINTRGMGILDVENIIGGIESRGNQAVLTVQTSDGSTNHSQFGSKDWKEYKDSVNNAGNAITDVWITEVEGGSYVRNSRQIKSGWVFISSIGDASIFEENDKYLVTFEKGANIVEEYFDDEESAREFAKEITSSFIRSARYIATDPETGEVLGSADTYEEAINEWGEDVTITDSEAAEGQENMEGGLFSNKRSIKSARYIKSYNYDFYGDSGNAYGNLNLGFDVLNVGSKDIPSTAVFYQDIYNKNYVTEDYLKTEYSDDEIKSRLRSGELIKMIGINGILKRLYDNCGIALDANSNNNIDQMEYSVNGNQLDITVYPKDNGSLNRGWWDSYSVKHAMCADEQVPLVVDDNTKTAMTVVMTILGLDEYGQIESSRHITSGINDECIGTSRDGRYSVYKNDVDKVYMFAEDGYFTKEVDYDDPEVEGVLENWKEIYNIPLKSSKTETTKQFMTRILSELEEGEITEDEAAEEIAEANNVNIGYAKQILSNYIADKDRYITSGMLELGEALNMEFNPDGNLDSWSVDFVSDPEKSAPTLGGELVRAARYIIAAFRDSGEKIGWGYAREMLNPAARFIEENTDFNGVDAITDMLDGNIPDDESYRQWIDEFEVDFADYLRDHEEFFHKLNKADFTENTSKDDEYSDITEFYVEDENGNKYWFSGNGEEYTCDTIDYATDPEFTVGDVVTAEDYPYDSIDFDSEFGDFTEEPFDYSWEDGNGESVTISDVRLIGGMFDINDFVSPNEIAEMIDNGTGVYDSEDHELKISDIM